MGDERKKPFRYGIRFKLAVLMFLLILPLVAISIVWNTQIKQDQVLNQATEKARVLADEMMAAWEFIDINQDAVNRNPDGTFRKKQLVCVVAAKSISKLFTVKTEYSIRFTSMTPRQASNAPDAFETSAFEAFEQGADHYSHMETNEQGARVFRYAEPLLVTETCLECHGDPQGELDQYGYPKEGMRVGEIAGAISISEPMAIYDRDIFESVTQQIFMVTIMLALASIGIFMGANAIVLKPLDELRAAAKRIGDNDFDYTLPPARKSGPDELTEFAGDFDRMARQLDDLYTNLEQKVADQTDELTVLNELLLNQKAALKRTLDRLNDEILSKNDFFALVSHELRTPLTSILAYARILQENEGLDQKTRDAVNEIETNGVLLLNLVNNILSISKTEAHRNDLVLEVIDYVDLASFVKKALEPLARNKGITLTTYVAPDVPISMADWEKLRRIIENLVDNAIKYTHPGGFVRLEIEYDDSEDPGFIVIKVCDNGIGIDEKDQQEIFELYRQTERQSSMRRYKGTGLGLAVVKELSELHGGSVSVESQRREGSTFTVRIPHVPVVTEDTDEDFTG